MDQAAQERRLTTIEDYAELPDDGWRSELVRGRVVREPQPGYEHGELQARIIARLIQHIDEHAPDLVCTGPIGVITQEAPATVRGPDLSVFRRARAGELHAPGFLRGAPELAIEILSPSNRASETQEKVHEYLRAGARLVWVIDPARKAVTVQASTREARFLGEEDVLDGGSVLPALRLPVADLFARP